MLPRRENPGSFWRKLGVAGVVWRTSRLYHWELKSPSLATLGEQI